MYVEKEQTVVSVAATKPISTGPRKAWFMGGEHCRNTGNSNHAKSSTHKTFFDFRTEAGRLNLRTAVSMRMSVPQAPGFANEELYPNRCWCVGGF